MVNPLIIKGVIAYVSDPDKILGDGFIWLAIVLGNKIFSTFVGTHSLFNFVITFYKRKLG